MLVILSRTTVTQASELRSNADALFSALDKEDSQACALTQVRHGKIVPAYGMANLRHHLPIAPKSYFIASTSKPFTSFSLALPEEPQQDFRWNSPDGHCRGSAISRGDSELDGCGPESQITLDGWCFPRRSVLE